MEIGIDGNEAFEQAKRTLVTLLDKDASRSILWEIKNELGFDLQYWGRYVMKPGDFVKPKSKANESLETHATIPAEVEGEPASAFFGMIGEGKQSRACGAITYYINMKHPIDLMPGLEGARVLVFTFVASNPHTHSNQIGAFMEYLCPEEFEGNPDSTAALAFLNADAFLHADGKMRTEYNKKKFEEVDKQKGQITADTVLRDWWGDEYEIEATLDRVPETEHEHEMAATSHHPSVLSDIHRSGTGLKD